MTEIKRLAKAFGQSYHDAIMVKPNLKPPGILDFRPPSFFPIPEDISILVGEICYNLRAALDYLIYELARLEAGTTQQGTQFPIEYRKKDFDKIAPNRLKGINASHAALIEAFQPYRGCDWTATLKEISNPDKHRELTARRAFGFVMQAKFIGENIEIVDPSLADTEIRSICRARGPGGTEVDVQLVSSIPIQIRIKNKSSPVVQTLRILQSQVAAVNPLSEQIPHLVVVAVLRHLLATR